MNERKKEKKETSTHQNRLAKQTDATALQKRMTTIKRDLLPSKKTYYHQKRCAKVAFDDYLTLLMVVGLFCRAVV